MAYRKQCDNKECGKLFGDGTPFVQIHGSVSDQVETGDEVKFRYLTPHSNSKLAFCNEACENKWRVAQRGNTEFTQRPFYPQG